MAPKTPIAGIASFTLLGLSIFGLGIACHTSSGLADERTDPQSEKSGVEIRLKLNTQSIDTIDSNPTQVLPEELVKQVRVDTEISLPRKPGIERIPLFSLCGFQAADPDTNRQGSARVNKSSNPTMHLPTGAKPLAAATDSANTSTSKPLVESTGLVLGNGGGEHMTVQANETPRSMLELERDAPKLWEVRRESEQAASEQECPGSPESDLPAQEAQPEDIPLEQDEHPYDAPAAKSTPNELPTATKRILDFSPRELAIRDDINRCLKYFMDHPETVVRRGPWALMHATLPFGVEAEVVAGNRRVNAIGWMCYNGACAKQRMFQPTQTGFRTNVGPGVQGHEGQFLAILAQSKVQSSYPILIGNRQYTIRDLARYEMSTCREKSELTFKLIGLSYYLEQNQTWRDNRGHTWNLEKMVAEELAQPINGAACGGTHRLMGLSYALIRRQQAGLPVSGSWARAETYLNDYVSYALTLQNADGSFSTEWFESRGHQPDIERKVQTTGHILEWLIYTLPDDYLRSPRIQSSIEFLLATVGSNPARDWPIGPRGHALRAMALYNQRVFGAEPGKMGAYIAEHERNAMRR